MCNEFARRMTLDELRGGWAVVGQGLGFPEGLPNLEPLDSVRITEPSVIIRAAADGTRAELVTRRWSWPGPTGKPLYNFRSDGRRIARGRCLVPVSAFYEYRDEGDAPAPALFPLPSEGSARSRRAPKAKWAFTMAGRPWFCIAGLWRAAVLPGAGEGAAGEAWTMLTCPPGPDIAPFHARQVVVLPPDAWGRWLDPAIPSAELCHPAPAGTLEARRVR